MAGGIVISEQAFFGRSEELTLTGDVDLNALASLHVCDPNGAARNVRLPDATLFQPAQHQVVANIGPEVVTVQDNAASNLLAVASGEIVKFFLLENGSVGGKWRWKIMSLSSVVA